MPMLVQPTVKPLCQYWIKKAQTTLVQRGLERWQTSGPTLAPMLDHHWIGWRFRKCQRQTNIGTSFCQHWANGGPTMVCCLGIFSVVGGMTHSDTNMTGVSAEHTRRTGCDGDQFKIGTSSPSSTTTPFVVSRSKPWARTISCPRIPYTEIIALSVQIKNE